MISANPTVAAGEPGSPMFLARIARRPPASRVGAPPPSGTTAAAAGALHDDEAALVMRLRAGDAAAYEQLVRGASGRMLATARRILGDEDDARDAVQEAFLSAFRAIDRFGGGARLSTWLHRIVVNAALMRLRTRRRHPEIAIDDLLPRFDAEGNATPTPELPDDDAPDPCEGRDRARLHARVQACIDRLPDRYRAVLVLRDVEEVSTDDAARMLGLSRVNVKTRLHRARQALKTLLEREGAL